MARRTDGKLTARKQADKSPYEVLDGPFFLDYALFAGDLRVLSATLIAEQALCQQSTNHDRRLLFLEALLLFHFRLEDAAAFVDALAMYRKGMIKWPVEHLMTYSPGEAQLERVLKKHKINSPYGLLSAQGGDALLCHASELLTENRRGKPERSKVSLQCAPDALKKWCRFVVEDAVRNETPPHGRRAYNKLKHGPVEIGVQSDLLSGRDNSLALIYESEPVEEKPFTLHSFERWGKHEVEKLCKQVATIYAGLRLVALLYVSERYSDLISQRATDVRDTVRSAHRWGEIGALLADVCAGT